MAIARHKTRQRELREGRELSRRAQRGDRRAFELLYASYESRLYRFCHRLTGSEVAAAALVEATFARAFANLPARGVPIDVAAHLYATARALAYQTNGGPPRASAAGGEHIREVAAANRRLAPRQRMVLALRDLEGRSDEEIARTLGTDVPTVAALVARARLRLRAELRLPADVAGCSAVLPALSAYADGTLPFDERPQLETHVAGCAHCRAALFALEEAALRYRALPVPLPPGELSTRMTAALDAVGLAELRPPAAAAAAEPSVATGGRQTAAAAAMAALVVVGAGVTIAASRDGREDRGEPARAPSPQREAASGAAITRSSLTTNTGAPRAKQVRRTPPLTHHLRAGPRRVFVKRAQPVVHAPAKSAKPRTVSPAAPASPPAPPPPAPIPKREPPRKIPVVILPPVAPTHTPATADAPPPPPEPPPPAETTPA